MARKMPTRDQVVKLIVGAGKASPSPPVGPALGSKGVKSMDFCKVITGPFLLEVANRRKRSSMHAQLTCRPVSRSQLESQSDLTGPFLSNCARLQHPTCFYRPQASKKSRIKFEVHENQEHSLSAP